MYVKQKSQGSPLLDDVVYLFNGRFKKINNKSKQPTYIDTRNIQNDHKGGEREREKKRKERKRCASDLMSSVIHRS